MTTPSPLHVDFVSDLPTKGKLGMTFAPGKQQETPSGQVEKREVLTDVKELKEKHSADVLVSLLEEHEYQSLKIDNLFDVCKQEGIDVLHFPIADGTTPNVEAVQDLVRRMKNYLDNGSNVVVHCKAGMARTGMVAAAALKGLGLPGEEALSRVKQARPGTCERDNQNAFVLNSDFGPEPSTHLDA